MFGVVQLVDSIKQVATQRLRVQVGIIRMVIDEVFAQSFSHELEIIIPWLTTDGKGSGDRDTQSVQRWKDRLLIGIRYRRFSFFLI
jgi:hypothetical protein